MILTTTQMLPFANFTAFRYICDECEIKYYCLVGQLVEAQFGMRGKKVINNNPVIYANPLKLQQKKSANRLKFKDIRSQQSKFPHHHINHHKKSVLHPADKKTPVAMAQCEIFANNRNHNNFVPINRPYYESFSKHTQYPINRLAAVAKNEEPLKCRTNNFIQPNQITSHHHSQQRIKHFSAEPNQRVSSRSSNNSAKKKGIELTKTLLRKISGMYTDKDFQNKSNYSSKSNREETTGIMTLSGKAFYDYDEYQMSDFDILLNQKNQNQHYILERNPLSFRDSGTLESSRDKCQQPFRKNQMPKNRIIYQHLVKNSFDPPKQVNHVKSYEFLNSKSNSESIVVGEQPAQRVVLKRRNYNGVVRGEQEDNKYLILSKNKTMDELSVKESMVFGFESYYQ